MSGRHTIAEAIALARHQLGTPYVWGGSAPGGFDCSGLVYWAYRQAGYSGIGRTTYEQIKQGVAVGPRQLQPGDIVFPSAHHEGLYVGNGMVLEAPHTGDKVKLIPLSEFGFMTARRLLHGGGGIIPPRGLGGVHPGTGLPVPSQNPADRLPHPNANASAALLALLSDHQPIKGAPITLPKPMDTLAKLMPQPAAATSTQPGLAGNALPTQQQLPTLQVPSSPTASGQSTGQVASNLDSIRRRLLQVP